MSHAGHDGYSVGVVAEQLWSAARETGRAGMLAALPTGVPIPQPKRWKNDGWYAAGAVWESWVTNDNPSTTPPSGHTLTQLQHVQVT